MSAFGTEGISARRPLCLATSSLLPRPASNGSMNRAILPSSNSLKRTQDQSALSLLIRIVVPLSPGSTLLFAEFRRYFNVLDEHVFRVGKEAPIDLQACSSVLRLP